jgi:hypothetical protein
VGGQLSKPRRCHLQNTSLQNIQNIETMNVNVNITLVTLRFATHSRSPQGTYTTWSRTERSDITLSWRRCSRRVFPPTLSSLSRRLHRRPLWGIPTDELHHRVLPQEVGEEGQMCRGRKAVQAASSARSHVLGAGTRTRRRKSVRNNSSNRTNEIVSVRRLHDPSIPRYRSNGRSRLECSRRRLLLLRVRVRTMPLTLTTRLRARS